MTHGASSKTDEPVEVAGGKITAAVWYPHNDRCLNCGRFIPVGETWCMDCDELPESGHG